ncbi:MAG: tRNA (guanine-N(7)-)-methyltransferase [Chrysothrix sp. TS-e1954]|nr:MAG: tRNA (guanine-N(7)-)-methyltransferase [Chrysothrix sp. TS-e1954]
MRYKRNERKRKSAPHVVVGDTPPSDTASMDPPEEQEPSKKKLKRDEYLDSVPQRSTKLPQKKFFRQRAHANPFSDHALTYPATPDDMDWTEHYPAFLKPTTTSSDTAQALKSRVEVTDIGCGYGGLLFALAGRLPQTLILGLEIRTSVTDFVANKIRAMRQQYIQNEATASANASCDVQVTDSTDMQNISVLRANTMKFLPNFFYHSQLSKIFLCFPDPHFKARKHKARIVSSTLCSEYAYVLRPGGIVYTITDVQDLHEWMAKHFDSHLSFQRVEEAQLVEDGDVCVAAMKSETEEGKKVERNLGRKFTAYWRRLEDPPWPEEAS